MEGVWRWSWRGEGVCRVRKYLGSFVYPRCRLRLQGIRCDLRCAQGCHAQPTHLGPEVLNLLLGCLEGHLRLLARLHSSVVLKPFFSRNCHPP